MSKSENDVKDPQIVIVTSEKKVVNPAAEVNDLGNSDFSFSNFVTSVRKCMSVSYILEKIHDNPITLDISAGNDNAVIAGDSESSFFSFWKSTKNEPIVEAEQDEVLVEQPAESGIFDSFRELFPKAEPEYEECITASATFSLFVAATGCGIFPEYFDQHKRFERLTDNQRFAWGMSITLLSTVGVYMLLHNSCKSRKQLFVDRIQKDRQVPQ